MQSNKNIDANFKPNEYIDNLNGLLLIMMYILLYLYQVLARHRQLHILWYINI